MISGFSIPVLAVGIFAYAFYQFIYYPLWASPLSKIPGPRLFAISKWRLALEDWRGKRTLVIRDLHAQYGPVVRTGPSEVSFASLSALRTIYGAGSGFERTSFYRMFDVYGHQNLFTYASVRDHAQRKKLLAHAYAKSTVLRADGLANDLIARNVRSYLDILDSENRDHSGSEHDIFESLHWFSLDTITGFLYGYSHGGTNALRGNKEDQRMLTDILDPARRKLSWVTVHIGKRYVQWLYSRTGLTERIVMALGLLPMTKPATYTAIRAHALQSYKQFETDTERADGSAAGSGHGKAALDWSTDLSILGVLHNQRLRSLADLKGKDSKTIVQGLGLASELADHFLAGIDTTSDASMFAIWALSRPENAAYQQRLVKEVTETIDAIPEALDSHGNPTSEASDRLPFLDAVLRETLRLYAPLPASEPRTMPNKDVMVDGFQIPAGTVVSMDPYTLHRNQDVFPQPLVFRPERWLGESPALGDPVEMKRWFWAFSSGARMCIGMHLAMAEMTMLLSAIYRTYDTRLNKKQGDASPGITSRFEVFSDDTSPRVLDHQCWIDFQRR
ncbi:benzoate 4-monooxygenase cytochrome p450 [Ophiostoma piceae UAMH 11346]|uniref:Benzoate 4-monooxygenase cytochrome p450 n=1 Tax=Ophiostoma piceae (strain UAMH 11346) TaxID=1262450 RepID=S3CFF3_OPHP1|nr:benzoate 4-monooxygenase cytochrome p450 [Ophiostoma piceae UAMH 11346]